MPIRGYISDGHAAFEPEAIEAMSHALETTCKALQITPAHNRERKVIAERIIDLARNGLTDTTALSNRVIAEAQALRSM
jgi:hypothetical protein